MKAAVLRDPSLAMAIEEVAIAAPAAREVLVRIAAVGLCHTDLHVIDGGIAVPLPTVLGHEVAGVVEAVGPGVHTVRPGDHVVVSLAFNCGHCAECHGGHAHRCHTPEARRGPGEPPRLSRGDEALGQFMGIGGFAERTLVHESGCVAIRRDMPLDRACLISCAVATGFGAVTNSARVRPGETVAVIGCGGVGLAAVNGAEVAGAGRVIAIDWVAAKLDLARAFGATDAIDASVIGPSGGDVAAQVLALTGGRGVDHAIECIGRSDTIEQAFAMLAKGGTATIAGATAPDARIALPAIDFLREKRIQGSMMGGVRLAIDVPYLVDLYMAGRLKLDALVSQRLRLDQVNEGLAAMRGGAVARSVIVMDA